MNVHSTISSLRLMRKALSNTVTVGFVPTMGALHEGHLSLVQEARKCNDIVVASIFVNPAQFGPNEDLGKYPRQLERDTETLRSLGVDHLFAPTDDIMYGPNFVTYVCPEGFDGTEEGKARPGHFRGVATVVTKLFNIVQPSRAYFGQKDAAQCVLIKRIVEDLNVPVEIVIMDTVREEDGLAMSSRNAYLTPEERRAAPIVYASLCAASDLHQITAPATSARMLGDTMRQVLQSEPLVKEIEYIAVDDYQTMQPVSEIGLNTVVVSIAVRLGSVRLIDNIVLRP